MKSETRYPSNVFWSWRKYLQAELPNATIFYNPPSIPKPSGNEWLIFTLGSYRAGIITWITSRITCVTRNDSDGSDLMSLVTTVLGKVDSTTAGRGSIAFYDKTTANIIGTIYITDTSVATVVPEGNGITSCAIDIYTRAKTKRNIHA